MKNKYQTVIIGSGIGGLSAAAELKSQGMEFIVIEKAKELPLNLANAAIQSFCEVEPGTQFPRIVFCCDP